jgi:hypothetical protein
VRQAESSAQDGLWSQEKLTPNSAASTVCRAYRVSGRPLFDALRAAWRDVSLAATSRQPMAAGSSAVVGAQQAPEKADSATVTG